MYFRGAINSLLPTVKKFKYQELEVEFDRELQLASQTAYQLLDRDKPQRLIHRLRHSLSDNPNAAIIDAWKAVEAAAKSVVDNYQGEVNWDTKTPYKHLEEILTHEKLLDTNTALLFSEVRQLRNKVSHAPDFQVRSAEAVQYIELCDQLISHLNEL